MGIIDSIIGAESGGDPNAQNSRSSAGGLGQFIDSTWLSVLRQHRPDLAEGRSDGDLLALKKDPALSREMTGYYAGDNQAILAKSGLPVTDANTHLAHFAGAGGAVRVLQSDPSTPVAQILDPGAITANPFLRNMTSGDLQAWAARRAGGSAGQPTGAPAASAGRAIPASAPPIFPPQQAAPQQQAQAPDPGLQLEPPPQMQPIFAPPRKQIDLSRLKAAFAQPNFYRG